MEDQTKDNRLGAFADMMGDEDIPFDPFALNKELAGTLAEDMESEGIDDEDDDEEPFTPQVDESDYVDPIKNAIFCRLRDTIRVACNVSSSQKARYEAMEWIFVPNLKDAEGIDFDSACTALGARPNVVRARVSYQLWSAGIEVKKELPFLAVPPPVSIISEISVNVGSGYAEQIARWAWYWPSIPAIELRNKVCEGGDAERYEAAFNALEAHGYIGLRYGKIYMISRNPALLPKSARQRFTFSGSFYGE